MKKKYLLMTVAGILVLSTMLVGTLAALNTSTEDGVGSATANISVNEISVGIDGQDATNQSVDIAVPMSVPGGTHDCPQKVVNDAKSGYDIYAKVVINKYWTEKSGKDAEGAYAGLSGDEFTDLVVKDQTGAERTITSVAAIGEQYEMNGWIVTYADDEQVVMYYKYPIGVNQASSNFMDAVAFDKKMGNEYADKEYHINVDVTAVQKNSAEDAIAAELGVFPVFDDAGVITSIKEVR